MELTDSGKGEAFCKLCVSPLRAHKTDLEKHMKTKTHKDKEIRFSKTQPKLASFGYSSNKDTLSNEKIMDIKMSTYIAAHSSIRSIDHLSEVLKTCGIGSPLENIQLHRSKCSAIIKNVLEPAMLKELLEEVGNQSYSIILDESTDLTTEKYMAYCIRYYNSKLEKIVVDFLGFQEVFEATANALHKCFKSFLSEIGLNLKNLIAIGTDGASNLCGKNHSLFTLLQADIPHLQLLKCVCHSLSLCASKASTELPSSLEYLLRETRNWFSHSPLRMKVYQNLFGTINDGNKPLKLTQLSTTRWLAFYAAVNTNINQWLELKTHFNMVKSSQEKCYTARELAGMYNDDTNLLYLLFLCPILKEVTNVNVIFQASDANITKIYSDLRILLVSVARRFFKPVFLRAQSLSDNASLAMLHEADIAAVRRALEKAEGSFENSLLPLDSIDFGKKFNDLLAKKTVSVNKVKEVKQRCLNFLVRLVKELVDRLPLNVSVVEKIEVLSPNRCLSISNRPNIDDFPWQLGEPNIDKESIVNQFRTLSTMRIEEIIGTASPNDIVNFWVQVLKMQNAAGNPMFKDLAEFSLRCLSLPLSNAVVERIFSVMGTIKTKLRNRMQLPMLIAILRIRTHMNVRGICCNNFQPSNHMITLHAGRKMYDSSDASNSTATTVNVERDIDEALILLAADDEVE